VSGKKWLAGCAIGCGGLIVLVLALAALFSVWVRRPGELLAPQRLLGPETTAHVEWTLGLEDPGTAGFLREALAAFRAQQSAAARSGPAWLAPLILRQNEKGEEELRKLLPIVATWSSCPGPTAHEDLHLWSVGLQRIGNRLRLGDWLLAWIFSRADDAEVHRHRDEKIYRLSGKQGGHATFFIRGADVIVTSDVETARIAVDRLAAAPESRAPTPVDRLLAETGGRPLRGAITNERGELPRLWRLLDPDAAPSATVAAWDEIRAVTLAGGLNADGSLTATLSFICPDARWAAAQAPALSQALSQALSRSGLASEARATPSGDRIRVELRVPELIELASRRLARSSRSALPSTPPD